MGQALSSKNHITFKVLFIFYCNLSRIRGKGERESSGDQDTLHVTFGLKGTYIYITNNFLSVLATVILNASGDQRYHPYGGKRRRKSKVWNCNNYVVHISDMMG